MTLTIRPREAQCDGKHPFPSRRTAAIAAGHARDDKISVYHCGHCGAFHIGHAPNPRNRGGRFAGRPQLPPPSISLEDWT